jgi:hypothetical protein
MNTCTVTNNLQIVPGTRQDYESLSHYHYRENHLGPCAAIYALKGKFRTAHRIETVGVIVYAMPTVGCQMRTVALGDLLGGFGKIERLKLINKNIRTISRVIIEPRFRSLGLAVRLVKETMPMMNMPVIESLAVMGQVNPFFEKAGMMRFEPSVSTTCVRLTEAFAAIGITEQDLIDPELVQKKLMTEDRGQMTDFIENEISRFLQSYGQRRDMTPGIKRTSFILSKLTGRPVYYLWKNPDLVLSV